MPKNLSHYLNKVKGKKPEDVDTGTGLGNEPAATINEGIGPLKILDHYKNNTERTDIVFVYRLCNYQIKR